MNLQATWSRDASSLLCPEFLIHRITDTVIIIKCFKPLSFGVVSNAADIWHNQENPGHSWMLSLGAESCGVMVLTLEHTLIIDPRIWKELRTQEGQHDLKGAGKGSVVSPWCQDSHQLQLTVWKPMIMSRAAGRLGSVPSTHRFLERWAQHHLQGFLRVKENQAHQQQGLGAKSGVWVWRNTHHCTCGYAKHR